MLQDVLVRFWFGLSFLLIVEFFVNWMVLYGKGEGGCGMGWGGRLHNGNVKKRLHNGSVDIGNNPHTWKTLDRQ